MTKKEDGWQRITHFVGRVDRLQVELDQGVNDISSALDEIFPYEGSEGEKFVIRVAILVDNLHLLDYC
jgi:hypothetical protein